MQFHTEGNFTGMFKDIKKSFKIIEISLFFFSHNSLFVPSQSTNLLIKHGETHPSYKKVRPGGVSSESGDQFANASNCTLVLIKLHSRELSTNLREKLFFSPQKTLLCYALWETQSPYLIQFLVTFLVRKTSRSLLLF